MLARRKAVYQAKKDALHDLLCKHGIQDSVLTQEVITASCACVNACIMW